MHIDCVVVCYRGAQDADAYAARLCSMPRMTRVVVPGLPHHVTQRGNRREAIFFEPGDQEIYRDLLAEHCRKSSVEVWAYCLMPNHVHLILAPNDAEGLARALGDTHRRYITFINAWARWSGHLFQSRYGSVAMGDGHLIAAVRYVSLNPVRTRLVAQAEEWPWSSVRAHLARADDELVNVAPVPSRVSDFAALIAPRSTAEEQLFAGIRSSERTGRPLGNAEFIAGLERILGRPIARRAPGRKRKMIVEDEPLLL